MSIDSSLVSHFCKNSTAAFFVTFAYNATRFLLLLPLSIFILYLGYQRWRRQRSFKSTSHSDVFTFHNAALQLIGVLGALLFLFGHYFDLRVLRNVGFLCTSTLYLGENYFHILTCVERYLAVIHPVTYMGLRNSRGVWIRNICIAVAWLQTFIWSCAFRLFPTFPLIPFLIQFVASSVIITSCSLCVLCALIRPGPGEGGRDREHVDQSKQRAFYTITAILAVLWLWFVGFTISKAVGDSPVLNSNCALRSSGYWFSLPSSVVLPLLYLHRTGKLPCFHGNSR
ncbi:uncharacterized protein LOC118471782 [Amphiprion ocellaris]|uniref:uncharacterized protein LOC118471782 n=1 Tax=Amphiprion ocellaris TaxID=80972 RepID=UPI001649DFA3|nr:uncharacterized protein LOC118471782 [Amphiprion ocellaris]